MYVHFVRAVTPWLWFAWGMSMSNASVAPVIEYLRQLEAQGQTHINVDDDARLILREFYIRAHQRGRSTGKQAPLPPAPKTTVPNTSDATTEVLAASTQTATLATQEPSPKLVVTGNSASEKISSLKQQVASWPPIRALDSLRQTLVFSVGNPSADVMLIGEAPGYDEERLGEPFVGKAGQKLDGILQAMGIARRDAYLSNIVKFRPSMPNQTTNNRKPTREEIEACLSFICEEVKVVAPKVIIALGGSAAQALLAIEDSVENMRGKFYDFSGTPLRVTYHPSYILHNEATSEKRKLWEDMLCIMDLLNISVSDKQQGYFLPK